MSSSYNIIDAQAGNFVPPTVINAYSARTVTPFERAITFLASNLAAFPRSVTKGGVKIGRPDRHPLELLLQLRPNAYQNGYILWQTWFAHAAGLGNGYLRIQRDRVGRPIALHNLLPEDVQPFRFTDEGAEFPEQFYYLKKTKKVVPADDIAHIQRMGHDGQVGADPTVQNDVTLQAAATLLRYKTKYLQKGTVIRATIEIEKSVPPEIIQQIDDRLASHFYGIDAKKDVLILTDGAKLKNQTLTPQQSQIIEQTAGTTKEIAQITGVPPEFLFEMSEAKYNASVQLAGEFVVRYTFRPWITQVEAELTAKLLTVADQLAGYRVALNPDALLKGDTAAVNTSATQTTQAGLRTPNEGRDLLGLPPLDDPEANTIKRTGDTSPRQTAPAAAAAE